MNTISSAKRKIACLCSLAWISGILGHDCAAVDNNDKKPDDIHSVTLRAQEEESPVKVGQLSIPPVAQGNEAIYERFLKGVLIYRPNKRSDVGMVTLPIKDLANPLEGTFNLSRCGNTGKDLSISTGYRNGKKPENARKVEIWICPRFLIEQELNTTAAHCKPIMSDWNPKKAPVGLFWTWGGWNNLAYYDYLTTQSMDELSNDDLYEKYKIAVRLLATPCARGVGSTRFHVTFC